MREFFRKIWKPLVVFLLGLVGGGAGLSMAFDFSRLSSLEQALNEGPRLDVTLLALKYGAGGGFVVLIIAFLAIRHLRRQVRQLQQNAADRAVAVADDRLATERTTGRERKDTKGVLLGIADGIEASEQRIIAEHKAALHGAAMLFGHPTNPNAQQVARDRYRLLLALSRDLSSIAVDLVGHAEEDRKIWLLPEEPPVKIAPANAPPIEDVIPELRAMKRDPLACSSDAPSPADVEQPKQSLQEDGTKES